MKPCTPSSRFSNTNLTSIARELRRQPNHVELAPPVRRKLEQVAAEADGGCRDVDERILLRRLLRERQIAEVLHSIRSSTCQYCHRRGDLITYPIKRVMALLSRCRIQEQTELACRSCACRRLAQSSAVSLLAGWWSPSGIRATPYAVYTNLRTLLQEVSEARVNWRFDAWRSPLARAEKLRPYAKQLSDPRPILPLTEVEPLEWGSPT